jgi:hypothetical protein
MYRGNAAAIVLRMNVRFNFILERQERWYTVTGFQSWRTTKVFLQPVNRSTDVDLYLTDPNAICPMVSDITDTINGNGGWTVCGWLCRGEVVDASAAPNDANSEVVGTNIPIHLAYIYPSEESIVTTTTNAKRFAPPAMQPAFTYRSPDSANSTQSNS